MFRRIAAPTVCSVLLITLLAPDTARAQGVEAPPQATFEPNVGQFDDSVQFVSRGRGYTLFLTDTEAVMTVGDASGPARVVRMALTHAQAAHGDAREPQRSTVNYLRGPRSSWRTGVPTYGRVAYTDAAPGVDLVFYGHGDAHEYDLIVGAGIDPAAATLRFSGADRLEVDAQGALSVVTAAGTVRMKAPVAYQDIAGVRRAVPARYVVTGAHVAFALGDYDTSAPLVIDPEILYGTYLGGSRTGGGDLDQALGVAVDAAGNAYVVGSTNTPNFPTRFPIRQQPATAGDTDAFLVKLSPGGERIYATYLGGSGFDQAVDVAVRADGTAFVLGSTTSTDLPVPGGTQITNGGSTDAFVLQINPAGTSIDRGTYFGGSGAETPVGIIVTKPSDAPGQPVDVFDDVLVVHGSTQSTNLPTVYPAQATRIGTRDGFLAVLDREELTPLYVSYAGVPGDNRANGVSLNRVTGAIHMILHRSDTERPTLARFTAVPRLSADRGHRSTPYGLGWGLASYSLLLGLANMVDQQAKEKSYDPVRCILSDNSPMTALSRKVCGHAPSQPPPVPPAATDALGPLPNFAIAVTMTGCLPVAPATTCNERGAVVFFDDTGHRIDHLNFGGTQAARSFAVTRSVVAPDGRLHMVGRTSDTTLPLVNPVQTAPNDAFALTLDLGTGQTTFLSYLGGSSTDSLADIAVDAGGNRWIVGTTLSSDFPVTANAAQPARAGNGDGFAMKISADPAGPAAPSGLTATTSGLTVDLRWNAAAGATGYRLEVGSVAGASNLLVTDLGNTLALQAPGPAGTYFARIRALTAGGLSGPSNEVQFTLAPPGACTTAPPPPAGHAVQVSGLAVALTWGSAAGATSYSLEAGSASGLSNVLTTNVGNTTGLSATAPPGRYYTRVRALNACGTSAASNEITFVVGCGTLTAPVASFSRSGNVVTIGWTAAGAATYTLAVGSVPGASNLLTVPLGGALGIQFDVSGVPPGSYYVRVRAQDACGGAATSNDLLIPPP